MVRPKIRREADSGSVEVDCDGTDRLISPLRFFCRIVLVRCTRARWPSSNRHPALSPQFEHEFQNGPRV